MPVDGRARQLTFDLARAPSYDPDDFLVSPSNAAAHAWIDRWPDWPNRVLLIVGPAESGKSHLAAIWAARAQARIIRAGDAIADVLEVAAAATLVEDADRTGHPEADLFHLMNHVTAGEGWLLITARKPPEQWGLVTPDLLSRLRLASRVSVGQPDSALIRALLVKLFSDRQILIAEDVVAYAALHCDQSFEAVAGFVAAVDDEALASGRRITRPLAAALFDRLSKEKPALED